MSGPVWLQILLFFVVAIPVVGSITLLLSRIFGRRKRLEPLPHARPVEEPYLERNPFVKDVVETPIDDVLEKCAGRAPRHWPKSFSLWRPYRLKADGRILTLSEVDDNKIGLFVVSDGSKELHPIAGVQIALPRPGETWRLFRCQKHGKNRAAYVQEVSVKDDSGWFLDEEREEEVRCGCLRPEINKA